MTKKTLVFRYLKTFLLTVFFSIIITPTAWAEKKIAVLPFEVLSKNPEIQQFGLGTMDSLNHALSQIKEFSIVDRGHLEGVIKELAFQNSGLVNQDNLKKLGKILGAEILVFGSIQNENSKYRINTTFTEVETGKIIKTLQVTGNSIFELQDQIASEMIQNQEIKVSTEEKNQIKNIIKATTNESAYGCYIKGRNAYLNFSGNGMRESIIQFNKALEIDKDYALALAAKGESLAWLSLILIQEGNFDEVKNSIVEAEEVSQLALKKNKKFGEIYRALGTINYLKGNFEVGLNFAQKALALKNNDAEAKLIYSLNNMKSNNFANVNPDDPFINEALVINPNLILAKLFKALGYLNRGQAEKTETLIKEILKDNPNVLFAEISLAITYLSQKKYDQAIEILNKAIERNPRDFSSYRLISNIYLLMKKYDLAITSSNQALAINPKDFSSYKLLGDIYYEQKLIPEAINNYKTSIALNNKNIAKEKLAKIYSEQALAFYSNNELLNASIKYQEALLLDENNQDMLNNLGAIYLTLGKYEDSIKQFKKLIKLNPKFEKAYYNLAIAYETLGKAFEAKINYQSACTLGNTTACDILKK